MIINRNITQKTWGFTQSFLLVLILLFIGLIFDLNRFKLTIPEWPYNILLIFTLTISYVILFILFNKKIYILYWLSTSYASISAISFFSLVVFCMTIFVQDKNEFYDSLNFIHNLTNSTVFLLSLIYLLTSLTSVIIRRFLPFNFRNVRFQFMHLGVWVSIIAMILASSDIKRYQIPLYKGQKSNIGYNNLETYEFPFNIKLLKFEIDEFPSKLALVRNKDNYIDAKLHNNLFLIKKGEKKKILNYNFYIKEFIQNAVYDTISRTYKPTYSNYGYQVAHIIVTSINDSIIKEGWLTSGSPKEKANNLMIDEEFYIAMTIPQPKKFCSYILIEDSNKRTSAMIEVNKPFTYKNWILYQTGFDTNQGKYSQLSVIEAVNDRWLLLVYLGFIITCIGTVLLFIKNKN